MDSKLIITKPFFNLNSHCGYCNSHNSSSFGFEAEQAPPDLYDRLINIGFRRSGDYIYKPELISNCCQYFTIRTNNDLFKQSHGKSKEMRSIVNKFNKFIGNDPNKNKVFDFNIELDKILKSKDRFRIEFDSNTFTTEKYELYKKYQIEIHHDKEEELKAKSFKRFLCSDPFGQKASITSNGDNQYKRGKDGALHMNYYLDDELMAIGVLDIVSSGVSSVYFLYDPQFKDKQLGKVSTLLELRLTELLRLEYYYLGFYIPNITKMKYKKTYGGELLDLVLRKWVPFKDEEQVIKRLEDEIENNKRDAEELKTLKEDPFELPRYFIGDFDESPYSTAYNQILIFNVTTGTLARNTNGSKEVNQLKRLIGTLTTDCIVKVW